MKPLLRPHATQIDAYDEQTHYWESIVDGEKDGTERGRLRARSDSADPQTIVAGLYGCESWAAFAEHLASIPDDDPFVAAYAAIERGDEEALAQALDVEAGVTSVRGPDGALLLEHALWKTDQGDWSWPPGPGVDAADRLKLVVRLLDAGADVEQGNLDGWTPLHTAAYIGWLPSVELLLARGARVDRSAKGDGGTPLAMALFWGHREAAERLAAEAVVPFNLRIVAALGRADLLAEAGGEHRDFYRPHSGFREWQASDDETEIRNEALIWACRNGRIEILDAIGADIDAEGLDAEVAGTTALMTAASYGRTDCTRWLLDRGADLTQTAVQWPGATPLHAAAWFDHLETVQLLVERGARCDVRDSEHDSTPHGWAVFHGNTRVAEWLAPRSPG